MKIMGRAKLSQMAGITLVELLVAITLSILMMTGAISIFLASKESFNVGEELSRVQENVRYISSRIIKDVTLAGYVGCTPFPEGKPLADISTVPGMIDADAEGQLGDFSKALIGGEAVGPNNSDSLTVHFALANSAMPISRDNGFFGGESELKGESESLHENVGEELYDGDEPIVISDCSNAIFTQLTAQPTGGGTLGTTGISDGSFSLRFGVNSPAYLYKMDGVTYQLVTVGPDADSKYVSQLVATRLSAPNNPQPLIDGVEDLQVEYGVDLNDDLSAERYLNWDQIVAGNFQPQISSVRISVIMNGGKPQKEALGQVVDAEKSMVKNSVFTIALRNRGDI
jgi:type IV pilus assembly protein PilW